MTCKTFRLVTLLIIFGWVNVTAQRNGDLEEITFNRDSVWGVEFDFSELEPKSVDVKALRKKLGRIKTYNDSMMLAVRAKNIAWRSDSLEQLYELLATDTSGSYLAYSFFAGQYHAGVSAINRSLSSASMPRLPDMGFHFTNLLNITWKKRRHINEAYVAGGSARSVTKNDVTVSYSYQSYLNYRYGFCVIDKKRINLYPFAGVHFQNASLSFNNTSQPAPEFGSNIYDSLLKSAALGKQDIQYNFKRRDMALSYGLELDVYIVYSKRKTGFILGARAAQLLPVLSSGWTLEGKRYSGLNNFVVNDYQFDLVLRVYTRLNPKGDRYLRNNWWAEYYY